MDKLIYPDIAELGWSIYLSAHLRWRKKQNNDYIAVMASPNKKALYPFADEFFPLPIDFYNRFGQLQSDSLGLRDENNVMIPGDVLKKFFREHIPEGYIIPSSYTLDYSCSQLMVGAKKRPSNMVLYEKFESVNPQKFNNILVFPRHREGRFAKRNLPKQFYEDLCLELCEKFPEHIIITMGRGDAYNIEIDAINYLNNVNDNNTIQDLIDLCHSCAFCVTGTSAPHKICMIQGVPAYVVGHERERMMYYDNPMETRIRFFEIKSDEYNTFNDPKCIPDVVGFGKDIIAEVYNG